MRFFLLMTMITGLLLTACGTEESPSNLNSTFPIKTTDAVLTDVTIEKAPGGFANDSFSITIKGKVQIAENDCGAVGKAAELVETRHGETLEIRPVVKKIDPRDTICTEEYLPVQQDISVTWKGSRSDTSKIVIAHVNQMNETLTIEP